MHRPATAKRMAEISTPLKVAEADLSSGKVVPHTAVMTSKSARLKFMPLYRAACGPRDQTGNDSGGLAFRPTLLGCDLERGARRGALTHPLSPNPFPPSPGRKGGPHFASGVRQRANWGLLKSAVGSAGTQGGSSGRRRRIRWFEVGFAFVS